MFFSLDDKWTEKMMVIKIANTAASQMRTECCMCGDCGLSHELFRCKICQFRSQHRYCSNLYPRAESYGVCNWCLPNQNDDHDRTPEKTQNYSSNSSSSSGRNYGAEDDRTRPKRRNIPEEEQQGGGDVKNSEEKFSTWKSQAVNCAIKKQRSPEGSPSPSAAATRKRLIRKGSCEEEKSRRAKSEEISNGGITTKPAFRNKVRRYKLLDEVSRSQ